MILRSKDIHRHVTHLRIGVIDKVVDRHLDPQSQSAPLFAVNPQNLIEDPVLELQTVGVQLPENYLGDIILNDIPALLEIERTMTVLEQITRQLPFERFGTAAPGHLSRKNVQEYIRANEEDFLTFKAKLLLKDAAGDPIKKAALINDMVQSIVQIPDPIQRSVYIKECARIMDIDENLLIAEVGRKRMASTGDREAEEFVRRQSARFRAEQTAQRPETVGR